MNKTTLAAFIIVLLLSNTQSLFAQVDKPYYSDDTHTVSVKKRTVIYYSKYDANKIKEERNSDNWSGFRIGSKELLQKIRVSQNMDLPVVGFIKSQYNNGDNYDCYIVEYDGMYCYLSRDNCIDNTLIDNKNREIHDYYESLKKNIEELSNEYINSITSKAQLADEEAKTLIKRRSIIVDSISSSRIAEREEELRTQYKKWEEKLDAAGKKSAKALMIHSSILSSPNTASGCDYSLNFTNTSLKTIKYLDWSGNAYNAVNDIVTCDIRRTKLLKGRITGPIETNEEYTGVWDAIIYNWSAKELRLTGITIYYTDGTKVSLSSKEVQSIIGAPFLCLDEKQKSVIRSNTYYEISRQIDSLQQISRYLNNPMDAKNSTLSSLAHERAIYNQAIELATELIRFKTRNRLPDWNLPNNVRTVCGTFLH